MEYKEIIIAAAQRARPSTNGWWRAECPLCPLITGKSGGDTFAIRASGVYYCLRCGSSGSIRNFTALGETPDQPVEAGEPEQVEIAAPEGFMPLWEGPALDALVTEPARSYLHARGFHEDLWEDAGIGVVLTGYYGGRVVVPVRALDGSWLGWVARDYTGEAERKYLYPKGMLRGSLLYEHRVLGVETDEPAITVEGVFDALPYFGWTNACLGKPSKWHVEALAEARRPVAVCLDGDSWREAEALSMRLRLRGVRSGFIRLPPKTDPNDAAKQLGRDWLLEEARKCIA